MSVYSKEELIDFLVTEYDVTVVDAEHAVDNFYASTTVNRTASTFDALEDTAKFVYSSQTFWVE